ncbi:MAG: DUF1700 domain-containing protein [Blautia sp.]|nr:DUF1700 domain-containing protein [Lachnoclostridium sp.]MCM1210178.1 DUF1700 domain-containing protein [Blautia sp.]
MDKREFIEKLQRALSSGLNSAQVAENVRYYQEYIESEMQRGNSVREVLAQLGDPRLLAKSIIEANKHSGENYGSNREYDEEMAQEDKKWDRTGRSVKGIRLPGWMIMLIVTVLVIVVIGLITSLLYVFAPVIIVGLAVLLVVKVIQNKSN